MSSALLLQLNNRCARAALFRGGLREACDVGMRFEKVAQRTLERARADAVNDAQGVEVVEISFIEKFIRFVNRFVRCAPDEFQFG